MLSIGARMGSTPELGNLCQPGSAFHHSFGAGMTGRVGDVTVLRAFYAWGEEGTPTTFTGSSDDFAFIVNRRTLF